MVATTESLDGSSAPPWDEEFDVVAVGYGIAGACAALEAHRAGADVVILDKAGGPGGSSIVSSGIFYLGAGTPVQEANDFQDDADNMYRFLRASTTAPDSEIVQRYCEGSVEHFTWLEDQGVPFERTYFPGKSVILTNTMCLFTTGNEKVWPFRDLARPIPRGHKVAGEGEHAGAAAMQPIIETVTREGIAAHFSTSVTSLVTDADGRVVGVTATREGRPTRIRARRGVILSTGGFNLSEEMLDTYVPDLPTTAEPLGVPENDGTGIRMGEEVGAELRSMGGLCVTGSFYPPSKLVKGILVNSRGRRFVAEDSYHGKVADCILDQPGRRAYLIVDEDTFAYPKITSHNHRLVDGWDTVAEMEQGLGLPDGSLQGTLDRYNGDAGRGEDSQFHKHPDWIAPLDKAPYAAFDVSVDSSNYLFITLGGLRVNADAEVLTSRGTTISGLYAAGACASTLAQSGKEYASGMSLGPASFFGRVAGRNAAASSIETHRGTPTYERDNDV